MSNQQNTGALAGIRVLDLSRVLGGPFCGQILADHGADVIKIEPPQGDETRDWGALMDNGGSAYYNGINRNKRDLALDIGSPKGREVLLKLLETTDVLVENFKTGTMEKWGIGYHDVLAKKFPRLIQARVTGFGADGPFGGFPGYDAMVQGWAGLNSINGSPESGQVRIGVPVVDLSTGLNATIGIMMALYERQRSGQGQFVEVALYDSAIMLHHPHAPNWLMQGKRPRLIGNSHDNLAPYALIKAKGCDVVIGAGNDPQFRKLCELIGRPEMATDVRFVNNTERLANKAALIEELQKTIGGMDGEPLALKLMKNGVPAGAAKELPEVLDHPHTKHREMVVEMDGYKGIGIPIKLSRTPGKVRRKPPAFGQDSAVVLREAGYSDAQIAALQDNGTVPKQRRKA
ncbi:MAG: CaiB/BaiF CoA-transferase family protein [Rhodospirillales bacterium]